MMATGIRDEVGDLDCVRMVRIELRDHVYGEEITHGVNEGLAFKEAFEEAEIGIGAAREKLDEKARLAPQYHAFDALLEAGITPAQVAELRRGDVDLTFGPDQAAAILRDGAVTVTVQREPLSDYFEKARATGLVAAADDRLFTDRDGAPVDPMTFEDVRRASRVADANITGQGTICSALHAARNGASD